MSTRKIKDAKDLSTNELIYFKGHAKATYMSDGSTVEDAIKNIETNNGNIDLSDYETKEDSISKLQESKDYTDTKTDELRDVVQSVLTDELQTIDAILVQISGEEVTKAKVTARLTALVKAGIAEKADVKNDENKTQKAYKLV